MSSRKIQISTQNLLSSTEGAIVKRTAHEAPFGDIFLIKRSSTTPVTMYNYTGQGYRVMLWIRSTYSPPLPPEFTSLVRSQEVAFGHIHGFQIRINLTNHRQAHLNFLILRDLWSPVSASTHFGLSFPHIVEMDCPGMSLAQTCDIVSMEARLRTRQASLSDRTAIGRTLLHVSDAL